MMKRTAIISLLIIFNFAFCVLNGRAQITYSNSVTYQTINNTTNNGSSVLIGQARITPPNYFLQNSGLTDTNAVKFYIQLSLDGSNWSTISTNLPASTNAGIAAAALAVQRLNVYSRVVIVTTNSLSAGAAIILGAAGP